jgi:hypothetical protein
VAKPNYREPPRTRPKTAVDPAIRTLRDIIEEKL